MGTVGSRSMVSLLPWARSEREKDVLAFIEDGHSQTEAAGVFHMSQPGVSRMKVRAEKARNEALVDLRLDSLERDIKWLHRENEWLQRDHDYLLGRVLGV